MGRPLLCRVLSRSPGLTPRRRALPSPVVTAAQVHRHHPASPGQGHSLRQGLLFPRSHPGRGLTASQEGQRQELTGRLPRLEPSVCSFLRYHRPRNSPRGSRNRVPSQKGSRSCVIRREHQSGDAPGKQACRLSPDSGVSCSPGRALQINSLRCPQGTVRGQRQVCVSAEGATLYPRPRRLTDNASERRPDQKQRKRSPPGLGTVLSPACRPEPPRHPLCEGSIFVCV